MAEAKLEELIKEHPAAPILKLANHLYSFIDHNAQPPLLDMSKYWVRKLCEKVFRAAERRRASTLRFRSAKAGVRPSCSSWLGTTC